MAKEVKKKKESTDSTKTKKSEKTTKTAKTKSKETKVKSEPKSKSKKKIKEKTDELSILDNSNDSDSEESDESSMIDNSVKQTEDNFEMTETKVTELDSDGESIDQDDTQSVDEEIDDSNKVFFNENLDDDLDIDIQGESLNQSVKRIDDAINYSEKINNSKEIIVDENKRVTNPRMTKYEMVRIIGERTKQLVMGAKALVKNIDDLEYSEIAVQELKNNMIPFKIKRPLPNGTTEIWKLEELTKNHLEI